MSHFWFSIVAFKIYTINPNWHCFFILGPILLSYFSSSCCSITIDHFLKCWCCNIRYHRPVSSTIFRIRMKSINEKLKRAIKLIFKSVPAIILNYERNVIHSNIGLHQKETFLFIYLDTLKMEWKLFFLDQLTTYL